MVGPLKPLADAASEDLGLTDHGLSLEQFEIFHPDPERVQHLLASLKLSAPVVVHAAPVHAPARLAARVRTPQGIRLLGH